MCSALCLLISLAILIFILRYRVHVHISYTPRVSGTRPRAGKQSQRANLGGGSPLASEITAALRGLGCTAAQARAAAQQAVGTGTQDFESVLRRAIQYAHEGSKAA